MERERERVVMYACMVGIPMDVYGMEVYVLEREEAAEVGGWGGEERKGLVHGSATFTCCFHS